MSGNDDDQENSGIRPADREAHLRQIQSDGVVSTQPLYQPHEGDTITGKMRTVKIEEDARFDLNDGSIDVVVEEELMPLTQPEEMVDLTEEMIVIPDSEPPGDPTKRAIPSAKSSYLPKDARIDIRMITDNTDFISGIEKLCKRFDIKVTKQDEQIYAGRSTTIPMVFKFAGYEQGGKFVYSLTLEDERTSMKLTLSKEDDYMISLVYSPDFLDKSDLHKALRQGLPASNDKGAQGIRSVMMNILTAVPGAINVGSMGSMRCQRKIKDDIDNVPEAFARTLYIVNEFYSKKDFTEL